MILYYPDCDEEISEYEENKINICKEGSFIYTSYEYVLCSVFWSLSLEAAILHQDTTKRFRTYCTEEEEVHIII